MRIRKSEQRFAYFLNWEEPPKAARQTSDEWLVEVSTDYPQLLKKLGGVPSRRWLEFEGGVISSL